MSDTGLSVYLVHLYKESTMQSLKALVRAINEKRGVNVPDGEVLLIFVRPGYMLGGYIPRSRDVNLEKGSIREP